MTKLKRILSSGLVVAMSLALVACTNNTTPKPDANDNNTDGDGQLTKITFVLDYTPNTNHTGLYVADALGYYKDAGIEIEIVQPPEDGAVALVGSGKAQFGISFQETMSLALTSDNPLPIVAVAAIIDHNTSGIISIKDKGIDSFAKMEGTTYSTWETPLEQAVLKEVMAMEGADFTKVNCVPAGAVDAVTAIQTNVDTVWIYEAWDAIAAQVAGVDYNFIRFSDVAPVLDFYTPVIIANDSFANENSDLTKAFMAATAKGYEYAIENPHEAAEVLVKAVPELDIEMIKLSQEYLAGEYKAEKPHWGTIDRERWTAFYDWSFENGLIPAELGDAGFTNEFLPN